MRHLHLLFLVLIFSLSACQPELPPISKVGANSVGALVDGKVWLPQINGLAPNISASYDEATQLLRITATNLGDGTFFLWELSPLPATGSYPVSEWESNGIVFQFGEIAESTGADPTVYPAVAGTGLLEISLLDSSNRVFSGEFSFEVTGPDNATIEIRDGRFDFRF
ncbi:MAG: hypothetical protein NWR72_02900 [Bacteroidia bacterium]|nr:hypothetical protein [Bacteroidia bacterium]